MQTRLFCVSVVKSSYRLLNLLLVLTVVLCSAGRSAVKHRTVPLQFASANIAVSKSVYLTSHLRLRFATEREVFLVGRHHVDLA
jgi:hypothetical protein